MPNLTDRLKTYGLTYSDDDLNDLTVKKGQNVVLSKASQVGKFKTLSTTSFQKLKGWIGLSDTIVKENPALMERNAIKSPIPKNLSTMLRPIGSSGNLSLPQRFSPTLKSDAKVLAKKYLYGDSSSLLHANQLLDKVYGKIDLGMILLKTIEVQSGAVLEINTDVQILWAYRLKIHNGGLVRIHLGNTFKVDVDKLELV